MLGFFHIGQSELMTSNITNSLYLIIPPEVSYHLSVMTPDVNECQ